MFKHFILTRWNLLMDGQSVYNNPAVPDPDEWIRHRIELFEKYTLASIRAQTVQRFIWLLAFAPETPQELVNRWSGGNIIPVFQHPKSQLNQWYREMKIDRGEWIITTRLDNDDFLEPDFVARIHRNFHTYTMIIDTDGIQWDLQTGKFYTVERSFNNSPFISLIEQAGEEYRPLSGGVIREPIKTCMYCSHTKMIEHFPSMKIQEKLYRMIIHDRNISNKIVGREINYNHSK